jgi:hypothetical protein
MNSLDKAYIDILYNVLIRFKANQSYKTKEGALKALIKRSKAFPEIDHSNYLNLAISIYEKAAELISSGNYKDRSRNTTIYAAAEDIRFDACAAEIKKQVPGATDELISVFLHFVIYWYYLK